jgi:hypothetical protein
MWNGGKISRRLCRDWRVCLLSLVVKHESVARIAKLIVILDDARLEDLAIANENHSLTDVSLEVLVEAGWI